MQGFKTHFQILELDQTASLDEMKQAYKDLVMVWHPDRFGHNVRLRLKAEHKLKQFNEAYEHLKQWYTHPGHGKKTPPSSTPSSTRSSAAPRGTQSRSHASAPPSHVKTSELCITLAHAEYILEHYSFKQLPTSNATHQNYQSGPFVLVVCPEPLALSLSVPCTSLQGFDRILLSIPCKSTGYFYEAEAQRLSQLLHIHSQQ